MRKAIRKGILLAGLGLLALAGCAGALRQPLPAEKEPAAEESKSSSEGVQPAGMPRETVSTAMYVPMGNDGAYILVDQQTEMAFTVTMPQQLYGVSGERIEPQQLKKGNILEITGDGCMLESYPGQYPGVHSIRVLQQGKPEDADIYQQLVDSIWQEPDLSEPPELSAEYETPMAVVVARVARGGWEWSYTDENGQTQTMVSCGAHPLQWGELLDENPLHIDEGTDIRLLFYPIKPEQVQAVCWPASCRSSQEEDISQGEAAVIEKEEGNFVLRQAEPGSVYQITASFSAGEVSYAFLTD